MRLCLVIGWAILAMPACSKKAEEQAKALTGGDPSRGKVAIRKYGCGTCHDIPGVTGATGKVGPPLEHIAVRSYLHGQESNTPETMIKWIAHPQKAEPGNAMPEMHVTDEDAHDIAAFLYTLR